MRSEAMRVATAHMMTMATVFLCFLAALLLASSAPVLASVGAALGFCLMAVGGWLGGRPVYELRTRSVVDRSLVSRGQTC
jgi:hypothetical protein